VVTELRPLLHAQQVADAAGMSTEDLSRLVEAGVAVPESDGRFRPSDVARARLVTALISSGVPLEDLALAVEADRLSFGYVDQLMPEPVQLMAPPAEEDVLRWETDLAPILGTARLPGGPVRADDLRILELVARAVEMGIPPERVFRIVRSFAQVVSRLVDMQREFVDEVLLAPAIDNTGSPMVALDETSATRYEYRRIGRQLIIELLDRQVDDAIFRNLVHLSELALAESGVASMVNTDGVAFIDISEYSRLSERYGDEVAAVQAANLAGLVQDLARDKGGRMVKSLGDGALVHAPTAHQALDIALDAVAQAEERGLWSLHAGVNSGQVVQRDGDLFGTAVNIASRVVNQAGPREVVATRAVVDDLTSDVLAVTPVGVAELRNISEPVEIYRVRRAV
jgi:class 3 adenylate cyclase